jgi:hypothetical protein
MSDFMNVVRLQVAANCSLAAALIKWASCGVSDDDKTSGGRVFDCAGVDRPLVRGSNSNSAGDPSSGAPLTERHGITRSADSPNVLVVDFEHFRFVRDVRLAVYGDRRSPLAPRIEVKP